LSYRGFDDGCGGGCGWLGAVAGVAGAGWEGGGGVGYEFILIIVLLGCDLYGALKDAFGVLI
jgi:hypothetical protein